MAIEEPGIQPSSLADNLQLTPSTVSRLLAKLEQRKFIVRTTAGKLTNVYPTPKAKELYPKLKECRNEFYVNYVALIGKEESTKLVQSISRVADKLED